MDNAIFRDAMASKKQILNVNNLFLSFKDLVHYYTYVFRVGWWICYLWGYWVFFIRRSNSKFTNVCSLVCFSVHQQNTYFWKEFKLNNVVEVWPPLIFRWSHTSSTVFLRSLNLRSINQPLCNMNDNFVTKHFVAIEPYAVLFYIISLLENLWCATDTNIFDYLFSFFFENVLMLAMKYSLTFLLFSSIPRK